LGNENRKGSGGFLLLLLLIFPAQEDRLGDLQRSSFIGSESRINLNLGTPMRKFKPTSNKAKPQPKAEPMPEWKQQIHEKMGGLPKIKRSDLWSRL
jgi:hypothetical protein